MQDSNRCATGGLAGLREEVAGLRQEIGEWRWQRIGDESPGILRVRGIEIIDHRGTVRLVLGCVDECPTPDDQDDADARLGIHMNDGRGHPTSWWVSDDDIAWLGFSKRGTTVLEIDPRIGVARMDDNGNTRIAADDGGE